MKITETPFKRVHTLHSTPPTRHQATADPLLCQRLLDTHGQVWVSLVRDREVWPAAGLGAPNVAVHAWDLLKEVTIIFITSTRVWPQVNSREGTQPRPSTEFGLNIY